jgi:hypothetical protein
MKTLRIALLITMLLFCAVSLRASGPLGIYGIIDKVVFEPSEQAPERIQIWGAFAFADTGNATMATAAKKGWLYFVNPNNNAATKKEWMDLKAVAGTGQAVGFGSWTYIGRIENVNTSSERASIYPRAGGDYSGLRIRGEGDPAGPPTIYETDSGIVRLPATGNLAAIVKSLQDALKK